MIRVQQTITGVFGMDNRSMKLTGKIGDNSEETFVVPVSPAARMDRIFSHFLAQHTPFGFESNVEDIAYHPLPYKPGANDDLLLKKPWRIWLELYAKDKRMYMGLDLYGDVILGRGKSQPGRIIVDLGPYGAHAQGVSREHVMLRPTKTRLFVIDRGSTNSTSVNGVHSGPGVATQLNDKDLLTLGNMIMMVHVIDGPGMSAGDEEQAASAAGGETPAAAVDAKRPASAGDADSAAQTAPIEKPHESVSARHTKGETEARETGKA
jgi:hypothetical protein